MNIYELFFFATLFMMLGALLHATFQFMKDKTSNGLTRLMNKPKHLKKKVVNNAK